MLLNQKIFYILKEIKEEQDKASKLDQSIAELKEQEKKKKAELIQLNKAAKDLEELISKSNLLSNLSSKILKTNGNIKLLDYILGEELTSILKCLVQKEIITIDDVINRSYSSDIFEMNNEKKALLIPYLAQVDEENIEVVRNFVIRLDLTLLNIFDYLWCKENLERKKIIEDLGKTNNMILSKGV